MAGGPLLPSSMYFGAASGNAYPAFYIPSVNTNTAGAIEGVGVVASLTANAVVTLQYNLPPTAGIPTGTFKLRALAWANATSGVANVNIQDGQTAPAANIGATTLTSEGGAFPHATIAQTWATVDIIVENKVTLATTPTAGDIVTVLVTFLTSGWTLAQSSVWQFSLIWE